MALGDAFKILVLLGSTLILSACDENGEFSFGQPKADSADVAVVSDGSTKTVERDVEAPDVFGVTDQGLWDGRPSLGGVWVAHPDVNEPERVIIRNSANGKFVIGALFRRERENPGPVFQVSSDAAGALGMLAGSPASLNVTALRRQEVAAVEEPPAEGVLEAPTDVTATTLDDPIAAAAAAIDSTPAAAPAAPEPAAAPAPQASSLSKPFIQIGIFSVEANATRTAENMRKFGVVPTVKKQSSQGKSFWRVIVGPAANSSERAALLAKVKEQGFADAYFVSN